MISQIYRAPQPYLTVPPPYIRKRVIHQSQIHPIKSYYYHHVKSSIKCREEPHKPKAIPFPIRYGFPPEKLC